MTVVARARGALLRAALCAGLVGAARPALGQATPATVQPLGRIDLTAGRTTALHAGLGAGVAVGPYVRVDEVVAGGAVIAPGDAVAASVRAEVVARFLLDPFREYRHGAYLGGGVGWRADRGERGRLTVLAVLGVEGPTRAGFAPAVELGLGGGVRLGIVMRHARADTR